MKHQPISENDFAKQVITYVQKHVDTKVIGKGLAVPNHWVSCIEEGQYEIIRNANIYTLSDNLLWNARIAPRAWESFKRQYFSPHADLLCRLYDECQLALVQTWSGESAIPRDGFHTLDNLQFSHVLEANYQRLLAILDMKGRLNREASRQYTDDPKAVAVRINGKWVDIPGSYRFLSNAISELRTGEKFLMDVPHFAEDVYGGSVPVLFMIGMASTRDIKNSIEQVFGAIAYDKSIIYAPQSIAFVMAERRGAEFLPRFVGKMRMYMRGVERDAPVGAFISDFIHRVPQPDLTEDEKIGLETSVLNWVIRQKSSTVFSPAFWNMLL